jgi:hypothetical protein
MVALADIDNASLQLERTAFTGGRNDKHGGSYRCTTDGAFDYMFLLAGLICKRLSFCHFLSPPFR